MWWLPLVVAVSSCSTQENYLGYDRILVADDTSRADSGPTSEPAPTEPTTPPTTPEPNSPEAGVDEPGGVGGAPGMMPVEAGAPTAAPTTDVGDAAPPPMDALVAPPERDPLVPTEDMPNHISELLGVDPADVDARIAATFDQLFFGDSTTQAIYYEVEEDQAYIYDVLHNDTRIDALGYGMMITVQLDHQPEFDKIWNYTKTHLQYQEGPNAGYFVWRCDVSGDPCEVGPGNLGAFYVATALFFAEARWGDGAAPYDYGIQAREILDVMRNKVEQNGGVVDGVINLFDSMTFLPHRLPNEESRNLVNPEGVTPAFFEIWAAIEEDPFWTAAADAARQLYVAAIDPATGLPPQLVTHQGESVGDPYFIDIVYPFGVNLALDYTWYAADPRHVDVANGMISFFADYPQQPYPSGFSAATGGALSTTPSYALMAVNGATASITTVSPREAFVRTAWELPLAQGEYRFYDGVNKMLALLLLSGNYRAFVTAEVTMGDSPAAE